MNTTTSTNRNKRTKEDVDDEADFTGPRPRKLRCRTSEEFYAACAREKAGEFRVFRFAVGRQHGPGRCLWVLDLWWPDDAREQQQKEII